MLLSLSLEAPRSHQLFWLLVAGNDTIPSAHGSLGHCQKSITRNAVPCLNSHTLLDRCKESHYRLTVRPCRQFPFANSPPYPITQQLNLLLAAAAQIAMRLRVCII